jgi:hypothetical protein
MQQRLEELRREYELGRQELQRIENRRNQLRATLLRISGAIQVLEELQRADQAALETAAASRR